MTQVSNDSESDSIEILPIQVSLIIDVAIILIFSAFLFSLLKNREKNYGMVMILILTISDLGYPFMHIFTMIWVKCGLNINVLGPIALAINCFNLYWTAALALYTYLLFNSIIESKVFHYKRFIYSALFICFIWSLAFPLSIALGAWKGKISIFVKGGYSIGYKIMSEDMHVIYFISRNVAGKIIPLLATSFYYWKVHKALQNSWAFLTVTKNSTSRLFWLSILPIACSLPGVLGDTFEVLSHQMNSKIIVIFVSFLRYIWEFLNLWVYWSLQKNDERGSFIVDTPLLESVSTDDEELPVKRRTLKSVGL